MESEKPFMNIPLAINVSVIVANVLFALLYPEWWFVGVLGAVFFIVRLIKSGRKKHPIPKLADSSVKE